MKISLTFACGLAITAAIAFVVARHLTTPLRQQLQELCGNAKGTAFWTSFSNGRYGQSLGEDRRPVPSPRLPEFAARDFYDR